MQTQLLFGPFLPNDTPVAVKGDRAAKSSLECLAAKPTDSEGSCTRFAHSLNAAQRAAERTKHDPLTGDVRKKTSKAVETKSQDSSSDQAAATNTGDIKSAHGGDMSLSVVLTQWCTQLSADACHHQISMDPSTGESLRIDVDPVTRLFATAPQTSKSFEQVVDIAGAAKFVDGEPIVSQNSQAEKGLILPTERMATSVEGKVMQKGAEETISRDTSELSAEVRVEGSGRGVSMLMAGQGQASGKTATALTTGEAIPMEPTETSTSTESQSKLTRAAGIQAVSGTEEDRHSHKIAVGAPHKPDDSLIDSLKGAGGRDPVMVDQHQTLKGSLQDFDGDHRQHQPGMNGHLHANGVEESADTAKETDGFRKSSRGDVVRQIVDKAVMSIKNGQSRVRIDLKPEFLGHVRLHIATDQQQVTLKIMTELPVVKEMIENHIGQLKTDLHNLGLEIDELDVFVANDHKRQKGDTGQAKSSKSDRRRSKAEAVDSAATSMDDPFTGRRTRSDETGIDIFG